MSMEALAKALGYKGASSIQRYESADTYPKLFLPGDLVVKLAEVLVGRGHPPIERADVLSLGAVLDVDALDYSPPHSETITIPEYDVRVSAGDGFHVDTETQRDSWPFSRAYIESELRLPVNRLVVLEVIGDSMFPTLASGDRVLVNMADARISQPGIFVLWDGDGTVVKRLELIPGSEPAKLRRISDNQLHGDYEVLVEDTQIIGRVVWYARRI